MFKLTYWIAKQNDDHRCYDIRAKTKREVLAKMKEQNYKAWEKPIKVTIEYKNAFDLMSQCMSEGSLHEYED